MSLRGKVAIVTGSTSGIGLGIARALAAEGASIMMNGFGSAQDIEALRRDIAGATGVEVRHSPADMTRPDEIAAMVLQAGEAWGRVDVLVNNAGIQHVEDMTSGAVDDAESTITTNLLGPIRLTGALLPALMKKPRPAILNVTSGLAFIPFAMIPTYCATKAALRSYTQSLRYQLRNTPAQVIEIIPPWVQTELQGERGMNPKAMPLDEYIAETMSILKESPDATEIVVERVKPLLRFADRGAGYAEFFAKFNELSAAFAKEGR